MFMCVNMNHKNHTQKTAMSHNNMFYFLQESSRQSPICSANNRKKTTFKYSIDIVINKLTGQ